MIQLNFRTLAAVGALSVLTLSLEAVAMGGRPKANDEAANTRIAPVARVELAAASAGAKGGDRSGEQIYKAACMACHETGAAGAPKIGDKGAWAPRLSLGLDGLLKSAIAGKNAMPPKGGSDANDTELARAIVYIANKSGASFKEPAGKAAPAAAAATSARSGEEIVKAVCSKCHDGTEPTAPKVGDKAAWSGRVSKGFDKLTGAAVKGHGKMPARGGMADLTDPEMRSAIEYMFNAVK